MHTKRPVNTVTMYEKPKINWEDILVIIAYFVIVIAAGIFASCRNRGSIGGYFLAGRSMHWIPVGASLFASNIGSGHFVGLAGSGAAGGIGISIFELTAIFILLLLGWIFVPVYISSGVYTMPEYLKKRFGGKRIRIYLSVLALLLYVFTKISADLYSGALFIKMAIGMNIYLATLILLAVAALFTIGGGLTAVIWTDFVQTLIMIVGAFVLMILGFIEVGGYENLVRKYLNAKPNTTMIYWDDKNSSKYKYVDCGLPSKYSMHLFRPYDDPSLPWPGVIIGLTISSIWYWCTDQVIVQRALAAKNISHVKGGTILAGYLKFLPLWIIVFPGMMARVLFPDTVTCVDPEVCDKFCQSKSGCTNTAYPRLVLKLMPSGLRGLMMAVMMSALISSLTSIFNSASTIFTIDIWRRIRTKSSDVELMIVGRVVVVFLVGISVVWIPVIQNIPTMFHYIQAVTSYLAPPVCAIFILAVFWKRTTEPGAFYGLMVGLVVGMIRFIWEFSYPSVPCGEEDTRPPIIKDVHYLHFGIILFGVSIIVSIVVSILTKPTDSKHIEGMTFWTKGMSFRWRKIAKINTISNQVSSQASTTTIANTSVEGNKEPINETAESAPEPWYRVAFNWICGIEKMKDAKELTEEEKMALALKATDISEKKKWRIILNINAILLIVLTTFILGFYY